MRLLDRKSSLLIVLCCLPLLFLPKINLISVGEGETAGLRVDDFCLLLFSFILLWAHFTVRKGLLKIELMVLALVGFSLLSYFSNKFLVSIDALQLEAKIFYSVRLLEYFLFFYIGILAAPFLSVRTVIKAFFVWNLLWMILQKFGLFGEFSSLYGYQAEGSTRVAGITSFPSEMGALLNLMFCFFLFASSSTENVSAYSTTWERWWRSTYIYWLFLFFAILIILTGSRIALVALVVPFLFKLKSEWSLRSIHSIVPGLFFLFFAIGIIVLTIVQTDAIMDRSKGLLSWKNLELVSDAWDKLNIDAQLIDQPDNMVTYDGQDLSWWIRIHKWVYISKVYFEHPECYLQGIGPGCAWAALDGGLLRILVETGVFGCVLFWIFFACIYRQSMQLKWMCISLFFNMLFFDAFLAYKLMSFFFLVTGYAYSCEAVTHLCKTVTVNGKFAVYSIGYRSLKSYQKWTADSADLVDRGEI